MYVHVCKCGGRGEERKEAEARRRLRAASTVSKECYGLSKIPPPKKRREKNGGASLKTKGRAKLVSLDKSFLFFGGLIMLFHSSLFRLAAPFFSFFFFFGGVIFENAISSVPRTRIYACIHIFLVFRLAPPRGEGKVGGAPGAAYDGVAPLAPSLLRMHTCLLSCRRPCAVFSFFIFIY